MNDRRSASLHVGGMILAIRPEDPASFSTFSVGQQLSAAPNLRDPGGGEYVHMFAVRVLESQ